MEHYSKTGNFINHFSNFRKIQKCLNYYYTRDRKYYVFRRAFRELNKVEQWSKTRYIDNRDTKGMDQLLEIQVIARVLFPYPNLFLPKDFTSIVVSAEVSKYP